MSRAICNPCCCPSVEVVEIPGAPGADGATGSNLSAIPPGDVDPEGVIVASPGQTYWNKTAKRFWEKLTGVGSTGWELILEGNI